MCDIVTETSLRMSLASIRGQLEKSLRTEVFLRKRNETTVKELKFFKNAFLVSFAILLLTALHYWAKSLG